MSDPSEKNADAYNAKAQDYDNTTEGRFTKRFRTLLAAEMGTFMPNVSTVLDVGCGNGALLKLLQDMKEGIKCHGIDVSDKMIETAASRYTNMDFRVAGYLNMPFSDSSMDAITVCAAYHHFADVDAFAREAGRVLRPRGRLFIAELYLPALIKDMINPFLALLKGTDYAFYSPREIRHNLKAHGFRNADVKISGYIQIITAQNNVMRSFSRSV